MSMMVLVMVMMVPVMVTVTMTVVVVKAVIVVHIGGHSSLINNVILKGRGAPIPPLRTSAKPKSRQ